MYRNKAETSVKKKCLIQAFECATLDPLIKAGVDYRRRTYSVKELYRILIEYDCPARTPAMANEEQTWTFCRATSFRNLRTSQLSLRARSVTYNA